MTSIYKVAYTWNATKSILFMGNQHMSRSQARAHWKSRPKIKIRLAMNEFRRIMIDVLIHGLCRHFSLWQCTWLMNSQSHSLSCLYKGQNFLDLEIRKKISTRCFPSLSHFSLSFLSRNWVQKADLSIGGYCWEP